MRRYFMRIAKRLAQSVGAKALVTGEALGQVASQTLYSLETITQVLDNFLVLRPLIAYDKAEIIKLANAFGTYQTSILPYCDSCSLFAPKSPITTPNIRTAVALEQESFVLNEIYELVYKQKMMNYIKCYLV